MNLSPVRSIEDVLSIEQSEQWLPEGVKCTYDYLHKGSQINPEAIALSFFMKAVDYKIPVQFNYQQWIEGITRTANMLRELGIQRGDVVAYVLPNLPETHWVIWGAETAGIAFALNPLLDGAALRDLMVSAKVKWLVTLAPTPGIKLWEEVSAIATDVPSLKGIIAISPYKHLSGFARSLLLIWKQFKTPKFIGRLPVLDFHRELVRQKSKELNFLLPDLEDVASYFCTGGTTGLPKIAVRTHRTEIANASQLARTFGSKVAGPSSNAFCGLPLFHVNAQIGTGLAIFGSGGHVVLGSPQGYRGPRLLENFWAICDHYRLTTFSGVPTVYSSLLQHKRDGYRLDSLAFAVCGAAPLPVELFKRFQEETNIKIIEGYGLTEAGCVSSINPPGSENRVGSIGVRLPWQQMRSVILDPNGHFVRDASIGENGTLIVQGPNVFKGYLNVLHNKGLWIDTADVEGNLTRWLNTGDLGLQDKNGYFWLTGRSKELIIRGGHNIDPKVIEEALAGHPSVALCAAVGRPDSHSGEVPVAYVQLRQNSVTNVDELHDYALLSIKERAAQPKEIHILDSLPVTAVGKIYKPALSAMQIEAVVRQEAHYLGIEIISVQVLQDIKQGTLTKVKVRMQDVNQLRQALGRYAFAYELIT